MDSYCLASDEDGARHLVLEGADPAATEWRVRVEFGGIVQESDFVEGVGWGPPGHVNLIGIGDPRRIWMASAEHGATSVWLVDSEGAEYKIV